MGDTLPLGVKTALGLLEAAGFKGYLVGGSLRDLFLKRKPKDFDLTTDALPEEILSVFQEYPTVKTGIKYGTVTVVLFSLPIEVTTHRLEESYTDHRRPDRVSFTKDVLTDLARRDFTINAMAYEKTVGLLDPYGGRQDLRDKILRCVGDPQRRFSEDALRILRALRFLGQLDFSPEQETAACMKKERELLRRVSLERVREEFLGLLCAEHGGKVVLEYREILEVILPGLTAMKELPHCTACVDVVEPKPALRLSALFHHEKVKTVRELLQGLGLQKTLVSETCLLVEYGQASFAADRKTAAKWLYELGESTLLDLCALKTADGDPQAAAFLKQIGEIKAGGALTSLKDLKVNGDELLDLGLTDGKKIGQLLHKLTEAVLEEEVANQKEPLLKKASAWIRENG